MMNNKRIKICLILIIMLAAGAAHSANLADRIDGTLKSRLIGASAQGKITAKTGTLRHVSCLSGFATTKAGDRLVFSIMMNGHADNAAARKAQDQICEILAEGP